MALPEMNAEHGGENGTGMDEDLQKYASANASAVHRTNQLKKWNLQKTLVLVITLVALGKAVAFAIDEVPRLLQGHTTMNDTADKVHEELEEYNKQMGKRSR